MDILDSSLEADLEVLLGMKMPNPIENSANEASFTANGSAANNAASTIYIEARVSGDSAGDPEITRRRLQELFESEHVCILGLEMELMELPANYNIFPAGLESVKAVEYVCNKASDYLAFLEAGRSSYEVNVYRLRTNTTTLPAIPGLVVSMPSFTHQGIWERLMFENHMRENILRLLVNMFKFSRRRPPHMPRRMNPVVLFTGQPGSGKSSLALGVIQKLAIRLNTHFDDTILLHVRAAPLISKYFGESAKRISEMFSGIHSMCMSNRRQFLCVMIDEVESLVSSRKAADEKNEIQDTIRATNALLTGIDLVKNNPNLVILCTSNLISNLDSAFMDRVGRHIAMEQPSLAARYQILLGGLSDMITIGVVTATEMLPSFQQAQNHLFSCPEHPSSVLLRLAEQLTQLNTGQLRSGRNLAQMVEVALADRLRMETCSLEEALQHLMDFVNHEVTQQEKLDDEMQTEVAGARVSDDATPQRRNEMTREFLNMDGERSAKRVKFANGYENKQRR